MTDANEMYDAIMRELNELVVSDSDEIKEERESLTFHEEADFDGIPPSLLSYFETSKSRAAVCEKLILEDFTASHHTEDTTNSPSELDKDVMNEQVIRDPENEENNTSSDTRLLPAPTESEALFTHNVSVCPNNEDEAGTNKYMEGEMRTLEISLNVEERKKFEAEREERHCEEMKKEEQKRRIERDFQEELRKIMEAEKLHQKELELMEKRAQEKLEQEFLLQQELIINLQRRVEEERRMREKEQKRMKDEEDKRKKEEEKMKIEAERKRMEEERRRKEEEEEERKIEEMKVKREKERKIEEEEKRRMEEKRKKEEERNKRRKLEDDMRRKKEEVERMKKEEEDERKREEERKKKEEARKEVNKMEREKRKMEELMSLKKEEEERKKREEENMRIKEEGRVTKEIEERKKQEERRKKKEVEEADDRTKMVQEKMHEEMRKGDQREHGNVDEEIKLEERKMKEEKERKKREEEKEEARKREEARKIDEGKETVGKQEGERPIEKDEMRKKEDEMKAKEEERRRRLMEEMRRQRDEDAYVKSEEELRLREEKKGYNVDSGKMEHESKTKSEENKQEEEEERKNVDTEEEQNREEVGELMKEVNKRREEEMRLKEKRTFQDKEREERVVRTKEVQERRDSMMGQNENMVKTENSSRPGPFHSESTLGPTSTAATPRQHDPDETISQTFTDKTAGCENQAATPPSMSVSLPVCLPEHTEQKRLSWMKDCIPWSKLSLQNGRKQNRSLRSRRGPRRSPEAGSLPPLCPDALLRATGRRSLREVTTVTLEDLPGCSLSTLAQCTQLRSLSLRRCGLKSLEGFNQLPKLCYIDAQENNISCVDCENMTSLRVLLLGHNKLTSIHGLAGAENLDVLDLSHNSITRIAGLESVRRLQRLSVDHNQLISTKGLRDVCTLLHLNCSHNHLASVEGLENSALLNTLDLRANSLTEPPSLNNQVLLGELHLDDNSISSLQGLAACWLPLLQNLSVAQNRITQLPSMSDFVSLANLDLRFNCMSELQNVCESLEGCRFLREVHLTGNPLLQESDWRSTLQKAVPGLRAVDDRETHSSLSPPAVPQVSLAPGSFLTFCQAQLRQTRDLQQHHSRELNEASSSLDAVKTSCRQLAEALQLATDQRFAHEYGDTTVADKHRTAHQTIPEETLDVDGTNAGKSTGKVPTPNGDNIRGSSWTFEDDSGAESRHDSFDTAATGPKTGPTAGKANPGSVHSWATNGKTVFSKLEMASVSNHPDLDLQNTAAVVIQQLWRKYTQKCGNISSPSTAEVGGGRGGDGGMPESGTSYINGSVVGQDHAATVIQAFWRGFALRRRLTSALAAVTCPDAGEDDTFEEVDVDEFVFDEAALEKHWTLPLSEGPPPRRYPVSGPPLSLKPPGPLPEPSQCILPPPLVRRSKQAWVAGEQVDSAGQRVSPVSSDRSKSPASTSVASGLSETSEKIVEEWGFTNSSTALLMLKRAQKMKSKKQKKCRDPSVRPALFRNCSYQPGPVEARSRQTQHNRNNIKVPEAEPGLQRAEKTERAKQERAQQWLHTQAAHSDRDSGSVHFLPEISSDILNGGRVQLVADPGYTSHHASGLWASSSLAAQPRNENNYPRRNSLGHATEDVPSPKRVTSAPSKKERISFRDNPVQLSGGWGGGKKRNKVYK